MNYFLFGYYGYNNFGDDLLLDTVIQEISKRDPKASFTVRSFNEVKYLKSPNITFTFMDQILQSNRPRAIRYMLYTWNIAKYVHKNDFVVLGGGGQFIDKGKFSPFLLFTALLGLFSKFLRKKFIIMGTSMDELTHKTSLPLMKLILSFTDFIAMRDTLSQAYSQKLTNKKVHLSADLVFLNSTLMKKRETKKIEPPCLAVSFIDYYGTVTHESDKRIKFIEEIKKLLKSLNPDTELYYISFQDGVGQKDDSIFRSIADNIPNCKLFTVKNYGDLDLIKYKITHIVTMRFHLALIGGLFGKNVFLINHEMKFEALHVDYALPKIDINEIGHAQISLKDFLTIENGKINAAIAKAENNFNWMYLNSDFSLNGQRSNL